MNKKYVYDLTFGDVLENIFDSNPLKSGWFQGENFKDGVFLSVKKETGNICVCGFEEDKFGIQYYEDLSIDKDILKQKFRRCCTQPDVMRKC